MINKAAYIGCRVSVIARELFKKLAKEKNTTPSKLLRKYIKEYLLRGGES